MFVVVYAVTSCKHPCDTRCATSQLLNVVVVVVVVVVIDVHVLSDCFKVPHCLLINDIV
jgi:hypothetical protein